MTSDAYQDFRLLLERVEDEPCELLIHHAREGRRTVEVVWPGGAFVAGVSRSSTIEAMRDAARKLRDMGSAA